MGSFRMFALALALTAPALPASAWTVAKGAATPVAIQLDSGTITARDGKLSFLPTLDTPYPTMMFAPGFVSLRLLGDGPAPEKMRIQSPPYPVMGGQLTTDVWYNGGVWLLNVFRQKGAKLIAFPHAEYHGYPHVPNQNHPAWKSVAVSYSADNGASWSDLQQILTSDKPIADPVDWGGLGDAGVVYDAKSGEWRAYYSVYKMSMARSNDPLAKPGSWFKHYNGGFTEPGLGGASGPGSWLTKLDAVPGEAPAVHWNTYLNRWVMVFHSYIDKNVYISSSGDGLNWITPRLLIQHIAGDKRKAWFPTIVGTETEKVAGQRATLYYLEINGAEPDYTKVRTRMRVPLTFDRNSNCPGGLLVCTR